MFSGYDENEQDKTLLPITERLNSNETAATFSLLLEPGSVTTEGFESFPNNQPIDGLSTSISGVAATLKYTKQSGESATTSGQSTRVQKGLLSNGTFPTEGEYGISINSTNNFEISLGEAIAAFSFWGTDLGDRDNTLTVELYKDDVLLAAQLIDYLNENSGQSSVFFFGSVAETPAEYFNRIVFNNSRTNDAIGLDQFTIATPSQVVNMGFAGPIAVPTPALLPGLLGFGLRLWQRRRAIVA